MDYQSADFEARLFQALASPTRLAILNVLRHAGTLSVGQLQAQLGLTPANVSQQLAVLRMHGLVKRRRDGTTMHYSIADDTLHQLLDNARLLFERDATGRVRTLDTRLPSDSAAVHQPSPAFDAE